MIKTDMYANLLSRNTDDLLLKIPKCENRTYKIATIYDILLHELELAGFRLNAKKCFCGSRETKFLGRTLTTEGWYLKPETIDTIKSIPIPKTLVQLQSFLGTLQYSRKFFPFLSTYTAKLYSDFPSIRANGLSEAHKQIIIDLKDSLIKRIMLAHIDHNEQLAVFCDASNDAISSVLVQFKNSHGDKYLTIEEIRDWAIGKNKDVDINIISCIHRKLQSRELKHHICSKELSSLLMGVKNFRHFINIKPLLILTDNLTVMNWLAKGIKNVTSVDERRILRILNVLSSFPIKYEYVKSSLNFSDIFTRQYQSETKNIKVNVQTRSMVKTTDNKQSSNQLFQKLKNDVKFLSKLFPADLTTQMIQQMQRYDTNLQKATESNDGWETKTLRPYLYTKSQRFIKTESIITVFSDEATRIPIPRDAMKYLLYALHDKNFHMGISATLALFSKYFTSPGISRSIREFIRSCETCVRSKAYLFTRKTSCKTSLPFNDDDNRIVIYLDHVHIFPDSVMLSAIEKKSGFFTCVPVNNMTAYITAKAFLSQILPVYDGVSELYTDNATSFRGEEFRAVISSLGIKHHFTTPLAPSQNVVEVAHSKLKTFIRLYGISHYQMKTYTRLICNMINHKPNSYGIAPIDLYYNKKSPSFTKALDVNIQKLWSKANNLSDYNLIKKLDSTSKRLFKHRKKHFKNINIGNNCYILMPHKKTAPFKIGFSDTLFTVVAIHGSQVVVQNDKGKEFLRMPRHIAIVKNRPEYLVITENDYQKFLVNSNTDYIEKK